MTYWNHHMTAAWCHRGQYQYFLSAPFDLQAQFGAFQAVVHHKAFSNLESMQGFGTEKYIYIHVSSLGGWVIRACAIIDSFRWFSPCGRGFKPWIGWISTCKNTGLVTVSGVGTLNAVCLLGGHSPLSTCGGEESPPMLTKEQVWCEYGTLARVCLYE